MDEKILKDKSLLLILSYAPLGLGHLRVSDAFYHGLPPGITPVLLGAQDKSLTTFYRFVSIHPITRWLMEHVQNGVLENVFTYLYRNYLQNHTTLLHQQFVTLLEERFEIPKTVLVIASHFGLAHQLGTIKKKLEEETSIKIFLVVQVTDDSPQHIWYVESADIIFVPSAFTKKKLLEYAKNTDQKITNIIVNPYPVDPLLSAKLTPHRFEERLSQVNPEISKSLRVMIPISGAAVGMGYYKEIISYLTKKQPAFTFDIIIKSAPYTKDFLATITSYSGVNIHISPHHRGVVDMYMQAYKEENFALEITKPSEQAFKIMLSPRDFGGTILLFTQPVGRQEYENLNFIKRHHLIPSKQEKYHLWNLAANNDPIPDYLLNEASNWRGLRLPQDPTLAGQFIWWCFKEKVFQRMMHHKLLEETEEIGSNGVERFWKNVTDQIQQLSS